MSPKKTFCVYATTSKEKIEWMTHISNCIEKLSKCINSINLTFFNQNEKSSKIFFLKKDGNSNDKNLIIAPKWIPDKDAETCMRCNSVKFTMVNRRVSFCICFLKLISKFNLNKPYITNFLQNFKLVYC